MEDKELNKVKTAISYINSSRSLLLEVLEEFGRTLDNPIKENLGVDYTKMHKTTAINILNAQGLPAKEIANKLNISIGYVYKKINKSVKKPKKFIKTYKSENLKSKNVAFVTRANELLEADKLLAASKLAEILGGEFKMANSTVYRFLKRNENKIAYQERSAKDIFAKQVEDILKRHEQGESLADIANHFGMPTTTLYKRILASGHRLKDSKKAKEALLAKKLEIAEKLTNIAAESDPEVTIDGISGKLSHFLSRCGLK